MSRAEIPRQFLPGLCFQRVLLPILSFVAQFYTVPERSKVIIQKWAYKFAHGPQHWLDMDSYFRAGHDIGMKVARCMSSHLMSMFLQIGAKFMFDYLQQQHYPPFEATEGASMRPELQAMSKLV